MMNRMTRVRIQLFAAALALAGAAAPPAAAQEVETEIDGRLAGYEKQVDVEDSTALTWLLFAFLAVVGLSVLFKDAKRSHLD